MRHLRAEQLDDLLAAADPAAVVSDGADGLEDALDAIGVAVMSGAATPLPRRRGTRRWRPRRAVALGAALTLIGGGVAAAANAVLNAHTGQYATGWEVNAGGPGEYLREAAPNFCRVALQETSDIPFPPGYESWRLLALGIGHADPNGTCGNNTQGGNAVVSSGALRGWTAQTAFCAWIYDWRDATRSGDTATAVQAASQISSALAWSAATAFDPNPTASPLQQTPQGLTDTHSLLGWFKPYQTAVAESDVSLVDQLIASHYGADCGFIAQNAARQGGTANPATPAP